MDIRDVTDREQKLVSSLLLAGLLPCSLPTATCNLVSTPAISAFAQLFTGVSGVHILLSAKLGNGGIATSLGDPNYGGPLVM